MKQLEISTIYSQQDPPWGSQFLGYNTAKPYTIANYGCLLTVLSIYITAIGHAETPETLNNKLKSVNGFVQGGLLNWGAVNALYSELLNDYVSPRWDGKQVSKAGIMKLKSLIDDGKFVFAEIDFNPVTDNEEMHWVGICGYDEDKFYAVDPWLGKIIDMETYGGIARAVISYRTFNISLAFKEEVVIPSDNTNSNTIMTLSDVEYANLLTKANQYDKVAARFTIDPLDKLGGDKIVLIMNKLDEEFETLSKAKIVAETNLLNIQNLQPQPGLNTLQVQLDERDKKIDAINASLAMASTELAKEKIEVENMQKSVSQYAAIKQDGLSLFTKLWNLFNKTPLSIKW